jgi:ankyrin repeat protein
MRSFTVRIFIKSAAAVLIVLHATGLAPDPQADPPISAQSSFAQARAALLAAQFPMLGPARRRSSLIAHCFTNDPTVNPVASSAELGLIGAALQQDWDVVRRLLDSGVSVETRDNTGLTLLMAAAMHGDTRALRALLARHATADAADLSGRCALHYAIAAGKLEAVELLLSFMPYVEAASAGGHDLLAMALDSGDMKIFQRVLERCPSNLQWTANTRRALEMVLRDDMREQVRLLLSKHPAPPTPEGSSVPLIAYAIVKDDAAVFHALLACGSDPNTVVPPRCDKEFLAKIPAKYLRNYLEDESGVNLLMLAAGLGKGDYVRALLDAGADRNRSTSRDKMLPLYFAARTENWQCLQMLLGGGPLPEQLRIEISLASQHATVIKDGINVFTTECSTGREGFSTPAGRYVVTDKDRDHRSTIYKVAMPYFMRLNCRDFGMHEGVVSSHPASHGCIRLPSAAARRLFAEIPVGTVVTIN